jgi:hypothetical protein
LGLISRENILKLNLLNPDADRELLFNKISLLDRTTARETIKVGIIYVAKDQED